MGSDRERTPGEAGNGALPRDSGQSQGEGAVPSEETSGRRRSQSRGKCDTKARGSSYKPRYTRAPGNAGERGTKGVIATSASPGSRATNCSAPGHPSRETGTHTPQPHATRGALRPPLQGCPGPRQASRLLFFLPPRMKSELGLCRASPSLLPTAAFLKCGERPGHRVPTHSHSCPPVMFPKRPQIRGKGPSVPSETPCPLENKGGIKERGERTSARFLDLGKSSLHPTYRIHSGLWVCSGTRNPFTCAQFKRERLVSFPLCLVLKL